MTKTLDELRQEWVDASAAYDRAVEARYWPYDRHESADEAASIELDNAQHAMDVAWSAYDLAVKAHLESMDEAALLKPETDAKESTP